MFEPKASLQRGEKRMLNHDRRWCARSPWRAVFLIAPTLLGSAACDSATEPGAGHAAAALNASFANAPQTRFVAQAGIDGAGCTDPDNPCATVGFAIAQADDGDVIDIAAGEYTEPITIDKSLTLRGAGQTETYLQTRRLPAPAIGQRVITIGPGLVAHIAGVTIRRGIASGNSEPPRLGGGIYNDRSVLHLTSVTLTRNKTLGGGGAAVANVNASGTFSNVTFLENFTDSSGGRGGGLLNIGSDPILTNVVFTGNSAERGGGMFNSGSSPSLTNVTFANNIAELSGGGLFNEDQSAPILLNSIVWGHLIGEDEGREIFNDESSSIELHHSLYGNAPGDIVEGGGFEATNSLTANPLFLRLWGGNLRLRDASPAIDAGDPDTDLALFPSDGVGNPIDLDGNPRVIGDFIDIGAYERQESTGLPVSSRS